MSLIRVSVAVLALAAAPHAFAGVVIEAQSIDDGEKTTQRILMDGKKLRLDSEDGAMIFDGNTNRTIQLDTENKAYTELTEADRAFLKAMMQQAAKGAKKTKPKEPTFQKTGRKDSALGKACDVYKVSDMEGEFDQEMCLAPFGTFGVQKADFEPFRAFAESWSELLEDTGVRNDWAEFPGIPLIAWDLEDGQRVESFRVTKVEKQSIPASEFAVPAGWTKTPGFAEQMKEMEQQLKQLQQKQGGAGR